MDRAPFLGCFFCVGANEQPGERRDNRFGEWMLDVWKGWESQHDWVRDICRTLLG